MNVWYNERRLDFIQLSTIYKKRNIGLIVIFYNIAISYTLRNKSYYIDTL